MGVPELFLREVVLPHADDPAVAVWDVMNEPTYGKENVFTAFIDKTATWLRDTAKVRGAVGVSCPGAGKACLLRCNNHTDVVIIHPYCPNCMQKNVTLAAKL